MVIIMEFSHHKNIFTLHSWFFDCLSNVSFISSVIFQEKVYLDSTQYFARR